ncbi:hypothetical protein SPRI_2705 [Streptomyces pristinaespiralis]|nr:hypothetical protein SPRI_2705 [Streptomyces pristinaespiralis]
MNQYLIGSYQKHALHRKRCRMSVDPTDPETFQEDENENSGTRDEEVPEADAAEQHTDVRAERDDPMNHVDPAAANEADAVEQTRVVKLDEDDYR